MNLKSPFKIFLISVFVVFLTSCVKDPEYKNILVDDLDTRIEVNTGFYDKEIQMKSDSWQITYIRTLNPNIYLLDVKQQIMRLSDIGKVENNIGLISIEKKALNQEVLYISMPENLKEEPRRILLGIQEGNLVKEIEIIQSKGEEYELLGKIIKEKAESREIQKLELRSREINNNASTPIKITSLESEFYKEIAYTSEFQSKNINAFDWAPGPDSLISMIKLEVNGNIYWDEAVKYVRGFNVTPYMPHTNNPIDIVVPPHSTLKVYGEVTYLSRECDYIFTLKNKKSGFITNLEGTWKQKVPIKTEIKTR